MYHFIINPSAGNGRAQKSWTKIQKKLCQLNLKHSYYLTTSSTDLKQHLRQQAKLTPKTIFCDLRWGWYALSCLKCHSFSH